MTTQTIDAPAGWYPVPGGGRRFWNGRTWTPDVLGAPSKAAEYEGLDPDLPPPQTLVLEPIAPVASAPRPGVMPPGWYRNASGAMQWWDGSAWGPVAPPVHRLKETGIAYLFYFLLGGVAAHRFYLGFAGTALLFNVIWWGGWLFAPFLVGIPFLMVGALWLFVDLFRMPWLVRKANRYRGYWG